MADLAAAMDGALLDLPLLPTLEKEEEGGGGGRGGCGGRQIWGGMRCEAGGGGG